MNLSNVKFKLSTRLIAILLMIVGLGVYYFVCHKVVPKMEEEVATLETQNTELTAQRDNLEKLAGNMEYYLKETKRFEDDTKRLLEEFPTFMYLEDKILYVDTLLKTDLAGYDLSDVGYGESSFVTSIPVDDTTTLELYAVPLNGEFDNVSYLELKALIDYGLTSDQRFVLNNIEVGYNEKTGLLTGTLSCKTYFVPGQPDPYKFRQDVLDALSVMVDNETEIEYVYNGSNRIDDLFGTIRP